MDLCEAPRNPLNTTFEKLKRIPATKGHFLCLFPTCGVSVSASSSSPRRPDGQIECQIARQDPSGYMSARMPEHMSYVICQSKCQIERQIKLSESMPQRISECTPDRMPEYMSIRMPHKMSECMPEKCHGGDHSK